MRVVYKNTVVGKILDLIREAHRAGKEIDFIEITHLEYNNLMRENHAPTCSISMTSFGAECNGVKLRVVGPYYVGSPITEGYSVSNSQDTQPRSPYGRFEGR